MRGLVRSYVTLAITLAINEDEWLDSRPSPFTTGEATRSTLSVERWLSPRAGLDAMGRENRLPVPRIDPRYFGCPAHRLIVLPTELKCSKNVSLNKERPRKILKYDSPVNVLKITIQFILGTKVFT
jgi:hypothetical protein